MLRCLPFMLAIALHLLAGCGEPKMASTPAPAAGVPAEYFLTASPGQPKPIEQLKKDAKQGDEVIVRVVVGGEMEPIVAGLAAMTVIDASLPSCRANPDDTCETPWDYCCTAAEELNRHKAFVQVVDKAGKALKASFASGNRIKPHDTLVVKGIVGPRPDGQALEINASGIFVESSLKKG